MGGSTQSSPVGYLSRPSYVTPESEIGMMSSLDIQGQANRNKILDLSTSIPLETNTPDIYGAQGYANQVADTSLVNAYKSKQLEQQQNPQAATARQALQAAAAQDVDPTYWQKQMNQWALGKGLESYLGTGLADSTVGKSGFFDQSTAQGAALRNQNLAQAQQIIGKAPVAGIDPGQAASALQKSQSEGMRERNAAIQGAVMGAQANQQSSTDWINQLMGSISGASNANNQDWQNYRQALLTNATNNAASSNAGMGGMLGGLGSLGGSLLGSSGGSGGSSGGLGSLGGSGGSSGGSSENKWGSAASGAASGAVQGYQVGGIYGAAAGAIAGGVSGYYK
jgi:hypothetical protein